MTVHVGMLLFPDLTQLDLTGPLEVFHRIPDAAVHLVWKSRDPVRADCGLVILPSTTIEQCPRLDVICVPGGRGQVPLMQDPEILSFLRSQAETARWVTSVCTGSLLLGAAGLLRGYAATTHWAFTELLPLFGAKPTPGRVVIDRNRITGGGVTAGIDLGLRILAELAGERAAKMVELGLEYAPEPPFRCGHPDLADAPLVEDARASLKALLEKRRALAVQVGAAVPDP